MMLQLGDDGVLRNADEENLVYVDEKELEELIDKANELLEENKQLKQFQDKVFDLINKKIEEVDTIGAEVLKDLRKELN